MKDVIEILNSRGEFKDRLDIIKEGISELKDRTEKVIQNAAYRERKK